MPPTLILIRHAEAFHNVSKEYGIPDPELSKLGETQCKELQENLKNLPLANDVELIVVSPMRRTLQTATLGLGWLIEEGVQVLPDARWQETTAKPCDTGSPISTISALFPQIDFSTVDPVYPNKTTPASNPYIFSKRAVQARGQACLKALYNRPEKVIAVVSHSGFLRCVISLTWYANADYRIFEFDEEAMGKVNVGEELFVLREWKETAERGGGMGRSQKGRFEVSDSDFPE
ncbi:phosphoglycerate mutase-like protein [Lepidopterella palustris CBS 459.81]|uniref:Phosphoglycerate mutase-like protein n=1 Tax=Lepidopterella palustris CBS 459.81 TaxID=1314670 RepID=A0A8E2JDK7_9PEZI|nr:phosphoglycerate mutase-like protein [Lepidopterella palustris CBS 459.81]